MYNVLLALLIVVSVLIVVAVMMQPSKQQDAMNALTGGAGDLFAEKKARGFEAVMQRATAVLGTLFFVIALALVYLSAHK
ncbi:preprotein translocase subunit SecG [Periweissella cryptocerci]|uniref:Protein-export membrane protein SecG n=1 Tax=Periweissella cryptocerci TaxID=2506420 RepID=A0A4P6YS91_9LACO|nr:preprotein translocase subunit SecG [Periweissella cryptocerci]QBO35506.1 preprotein translocase subunit SecG [Periweissella cryptocerci]